jgi:hypothetical protein
MDKKKFISITLQKKFRQYKKLAMVNIKMIAWVSQSKEVKISEL